MKKADQYEFCLLNKQQEIEEFEKGIYSAFSMKDEWMMDNYIIIDDNRLKAPFAECFTKFYGIKMKDRLVGGLSLNLNNRSKTQYEMLGFEVEEKENTCEALNLYFTKEICSILQVLTIFDFVIEHLRKNNISTIYGTCDRDKLAFFQFLGFQALEEKRQEYLLKLDNI